MLLVLLATLLGPLTAPADEPQAGQQEVPHGKAQVLALIEKTVADVKTVSSDFRQERRLAMLRDPAVSSGRFYYEHPDKMRWEFLKPAVSGFLVNGDTAKQWKGKDTPPEEFDAKQNPVIRLIADQIFAWTKADFPWIEKRYTIDVARESPIVLKLVPKSSKERKYVDHLLVSFEAGTNYVNGVDIVEKGGDSTRIKFFNMAVNGPLENNLFQ